MSSLEKKLESFKGGNADGNKRNMKAIQGCRKRMKLQTKKEFDLVKPLPHQMLLVSWLLTLFQLPDNSL